MSEEKSAKPASAAALSIPPGSLPKLRADLRISEQTFEGRTYFVIKDPITLQYFRMERQEYFIASHLDGERTAGQMRVLFDKQFPNEPTSEENVVRFINMLGQLGFLQLSGPKATQTMQAVAKARKTKWIDLASRSMLYFRLPVIDPDRLLSRMVKPLRFIWTGAFGILSLAVMAAALVCVTMSLDSFAAAKNYNFFTPHNLILFWISFVLMKTIHEFGHGLTCRHYGGEVHEMGLLIIVFTPYFYCDVTDAWMIPRKLPKVLITAAGIYVEVIIASAAAIFWSLTQPGLWNQWAFNMMILGSISTFVFNANPLLKYDGYYALADLMEIPNLRARSNQYVNLWLRKWIFGSPIPSEVNASGRGRLFMFYAVASYLYGWLVLLSIMVVFRHLLDPYGLGWVGTWMSYFALVTWVGLPCWKFIQTVRKEAKEKPDDLKMRRPAWIAAGLGVAILLVCVCPTNFEVDRRCVLEAKQQTIIRPAVPGFVRKVVVREGDRVAEGQVLAELENREVTQRCRELTDRLRIAELMVQQNETGNDFGTIKEARLMREQVRLALTKAEKDLADLSLRAPIAGVVLTPRLHDLKGRYVQPNQDFCSIAPLDKLRAVVPLDQHEVYHVRKQSKAELKVFARMGLFECEVTNDPLVQMEKDLHPALTTGLGGDVAAEQDERGNIRPTVKTYQAELEILNPELLLRPGMSGRVHILGERTTYGGRILRAVSDSLSLDWRL